MEIKHTIEILTKDIQDIEKLVGNLQNSQDGSSIELDLALSKMRNVYEILTMIKADRFNEMISPEKNVIRAPVQETEVASTRTPSPKSEPAPVPQPIPVSQPEPLSHPEGVSQPEPTPISQTEPKPETTPKPAPESVSEEKGDSGILAEKFSAESSINENLAGKRGKDAESKLIGKSIDNIGRNIGINDRFLIIRELFEGNADGFGVLVNNLEGAGNYEDAFHLLEQQFSTSMDHEGVEILSGLIKRRYSK